MHPRLKLERPLLFFDLEATGLDIMRDRIVEIAMIKVLPNGEEHKYHKYVNPGIPIPSEASAVHHIYDQDVADAPSFADIAQEVVAFISGCDIAGFNCNRFDVPLLAEELHRANMQDVDLHECKVVDVQTIFHKKEPRTLSAAYRLYCGQELEGAHSAYEDTKATYDVFLKQLDRYSDLPGSISELSDFTTHHKQADFGGRIIFNEQGEEILNFGKYKGKRIADLIRYSSDYIDWMLQADFSADTKKVIQQIRKRLKG